MFPGNDIVSSLIAVQMGGTGGGGVTSDIFELIESLEPYVVMPVFDDYYYKIFKLPFGYVQPYLIWNQCATDSSGINHFGIKEKWTCNNGFAKALYKGDILLYSGMPSYDTNQNRKCEKWKYSSEINDFYLSSVQEYYDGVYDWAYSSGKGFYAYQDGYGTYYYSIKTSVHSVEYDIYGNITSEQTNDTSQSRSDNIGQGTNYYYTPFKGKELLDIMLTTSKDFSDYALSQQSS